ncbi:actin-like ATPase domain-containing protein [Myriangium duriaei CBS 260.36]|uniref:Phosphotransferase n=1 Tax=Myriangium duriaei CBS 260.36 TaxID=1168546 RepID=A0A9P4JAY1_9PEZI|nr:actin-like ATPase domain-containing protein [Myriangium duriaei CBS 260.36]
MDHDYLHDFLQEVQSMFQECLSPTSLCKLSHKLQREFYEKLQCSNISMLPSYHHILPTGFEKGTFLALDVGGTNLRVASIGLDGHSPQKSGIRVKSSKSFRADANIRSLQGTKFFDWIAGNIQAVLEEGHNATEPGSGLIPMGIAWSFPLQQTSIKSARLLQMGKGFLACEGIQSSDLGELVTESCRKRGLNVHVVSIVNDASATLLAQAYHEPSTRLSLILGTGLNAAIYLPLRAVAAQKYIDRPLTWTESATHVVVNTELSMYGGNVFPSTRWDRYLNNHHMLPDFQPLEQRVSGRYLGEIVRLILLEAIHNGLIFKGIMPEGFEEPYSLCTSILAEFESDTSIDLSIARKAFLNRHYLKQAPLLSEMNFMRLVCQLVSSRAAAFVATAIHALCTLAMDCEENPGTCKDHISIACDGSVIEKYPEFLQRCQDHIDRLHLEAGSSDRAIKLVLMSDSSVLGAAVAAACDC